MISKSLEEYIKTMYILKMQNDNIQFIYSVFSVE